MKLMAVAPNPPHRVPDILVMSRPFQQTDRVVLDAPLVVIEILSPDDEE